MNRTFRRFTTLAPAALLALAALTSPGAAAAQAPTASPQEIAIARQTAFEALTAYRAGQYEKALQLFEQAKAVYPSAQVLRLEGYTLLALEQWVKAADSMDASLTSEIGPLSPEDRADVGQQLAKALAHLGIINISSTVPGAKLAVDGGEAMALPLNKPLRLIEGKHTFVVTAPEHDDAEEEISLEGGKTVDRVIDPKPTKPAVVEKPPPPKPPPPPPPPKAGWFPMQREIGIATGSVGIALGGATLATALVAAHLRGNVAADAKLHTQNFGQNCELSDYRLCLFDRAVINNDADRADALRNASIGLGIAAGVMTAAGVVLFVFSGDSSAKPAATQPDASPEVSPAPAAAARPRVLCGVGASPGIACTGTF
jgi:tetratricopeptide (TPR) repeat protein